MRVSRKERVLADVSFESSRTLSVVDEAFLADRDVAYFACILEAVRDTACPR